MKRFTYFLLLAFIAVSCYSCMKEASYSVSYFDDRYEPSVTEYTGSSAGSFLYDDDIHFLYEDICFEKDDVHVADEYPFSSTSAACYDISAKKIIYSKNIFQKVYPASTTKLLTALMAIKYLDLDSVITIQEDNCGITTPGAKLCGFKAGDKLTVRDMLYCLLIYSGNDAAEALAIEVSGNVKDFMKLMNAEAKKIGAIDTNFTNPHGLHDPNHYTTAYDIYLIFNECLKDPFLKQVFKTSDYYAEITDASGELKKVYMEPTNLYYMGKYTAPEGITVYGGKTGVTSSAGNCLVIYSEDEEGNGFITEIFKAETKDLLYNEMNELLKICENAR
ncbi:MAG: serine hydrolase [Lachnospiraceae bacterium]|nr:serine hydrolase [Lachnospiraceae bacterium]